MNLEVEIRGHLEAAGHIDELGDRASNAQPALRRVLDQLLIGEQKLWSSGRKWSPLAPSTLRTKAARGQSSKPLRGTGELERSLTIPGAPKQIREISDDELKFGTSVFHAHFHQKPRKGEPQRKVLVLRPTDKRKARELILDHLMGR